MSTLGTRYPRLMLAGLAALIGACDRASPPTTASGHDHNAPAVATIDDATEAELRSLKSATAPFQDINVAKAAGYATKVTGCYESLPTGAMGWHYGDVSLFDATLEVTKPEVLLYERQSAGTMRLIGVEYIVPWTAWTPVDPPELLGQTFVRNTTFQVWALHVWIWKTNPRGIFSDWNPNVRC